MKYNFATVTLQDICNGRTWKHDLLRAMMEDCRNDNQFQQPGSAFASIVAGVQAAVQESGGGL